VRDAMAQGRLLPHLTDAELVVQLLWAGVHGVASIHICRPERENWCAWHGAEVLGPMMIDLVFRGVLRPDDPALVRQTVELGKAVER